MLTFRPTLKSLLSILALECAMFTVFIVGVAFAWLAKAQWNNALFGLTVAILTVATITMTLVRGRDQAFVLGFVLAGWTYLVASFAVPDALPTTTWLGDRHELISGGTWLLETEAGPYLVQREPWKSRLDPAPYIRSGHLFLTGFVAMCGGLLAVIGRGVVVSIRSRLHPSVQLIP